MASIRLENVVVSFPIYDQSSRSLKKRLLVATTGGRIESGPGTGKVSVVKALDGDEEAVTALNVTGAFNTPLPTPNAMTIETKDMLLGLLQYTAENYDLDGWASAMTDAAELFDAFVISGITTEYGVWFLTREFFAGIVEGCADCGFGIADCGLTPTGE